MFELPFDAKINCNDGRNGRSVAFTFNPESRKVSHIVIEDEDGNQRIVPLSMLSKSSDGELWLDCSKEELMAMPLFRVTEYVERAPQQSGDWADEEGEWEDSMDVSSFERDDQKLGMPVVVERVPEGEAPMHRSTEIEARDGHVGKVQKLIIEPDSGLITHFVLQKGHLWGKKELIVPFAAVDDIDYETIYLNVDKKAVKDFPELP